MNEKYTRVKFLDKNKQNKVMEGVNEYIKEYE